MHSIDMHSLLIIILIMHSLPKYRFSWAVLLACYSINVFLMCSQCVTHQEHILYRSTAIIMQKLLLVVCLRFFLTIFLYRSTAIIRQYLLLVVCLRFVFFFSNFLCRSTAIIRQYFLLFEPNCTELQLGTHQEHIKYRYYQAVLLTRRFLAVY